MHAYIDMYILIYVYVYTYRYMYVYGTRLLSVYMTRFSYVCVYIYIYIYIYPISVHKIESQNTRTLREFKRSKALQTCSKFQVNLAFAHSKNFNGKTRFPLKKKCENTPKFQVDEKHISIEIHEISIGAAPPIEF